jgi:hypothetical protein
MRDWRYNSDLSIRWRWVVSFTSRPLYPLGKISQYPLDRRLGGPHSQSGHCEIEKNFLPLSEVEPRSSIPSLYRLSYPGSLLDSMTKTKLSVMFKRFCSPESVTKSVWHKPLMQPYSEVHKLLVLVRWTLNHLPSPNTFQRVEVFCPVFGFYFYFFIYLNFKPGISNIQPIDKH